MIEDNCVEINGIFSNRLIDITVKESGIYALYNTYNGKLYVGSSVNMYQRVRRHFSELNSGKHYNIHLKRAYDKYKDSIIPIVLELVDNRDNLIEREQYWLDYFKSYKKEKGYNICMIADRLTGIKRTDAEKNHLSNLYKGVKKSEETKHKMSESRKGIQYSEETLKRMSESHIGNNLTEEAKEKLRNINIIPVYQYSLDGIFIKEWISAADAERNGGFDQSAIRKCCKDKLHKHKGFIWKNEYFDKLELKSNKIIQKNLNNEIIKIWDSINNICDTLNFKASGIYQCCVGHWDKYKGYKWEYKYC